MSAITTTPASATPIIPAAPSAVAMEQALAMGDLSRLSPTERLNYLGALCNSVGLNPLTKPFEIVSLQGKLTLYANKGCAEQLRAKHGISIEIMERKRGDGCITVLARGTTRDGRTDEALGIVECADTAKGAVLANAMMKAETKAKRRVTLSMCGLGMIDESELDTVPHAAVDTPTQARPGTAASLNDRLRKPVANVADPAAPAEPEPAPAQPEPVAEPVEEAEAPAPEVIREWDTAGDWMEVCRLTGHERGVDVDAALREAMRLTPEATRPTSYLTASPLWRHRFLAALEAGRFDQFKTKPAAAAAADAPFDPDNDADPRIKRL